MNCENKFCIYWKKEKCILCKISLDIQGRCEKCVYISIDEQVIKKERERILKSYEEPDADPDL